MQSNYHELSSVDLIKYIKSGSVLECCGAICEVACRKLNQGIIVDDDAIDAISEHRGDNSVFWNSYTVGDFAIAALHLIGRGQYTGNREEIKGLIDVQLSFS